MPHISSALHVREVCPSRKSRGGVAQWFRGGCAFLRRHPQRGGVACIFRRGGGRCFRWIGLACAQALCPHCCFFSWPICMLSEWLCEVACWVQQMSAPIGFGCWDAAGGTCLGILHTAHCTAQCAHYYIRLLLSGQNTPPPPGGGWVGTGMGGWVGPKFQHFGPPGTPPPPGGGGAGALLGGFGFVQGSEIGLNFSLFFSITFQAS